MKKWWLFEAYGHSESWLPMSQLMRYFDSQEEAMQSLTWGIPGYVFIIEVENNVPKRYWEYVGNNEWIERA